MKICVIFFLMIGTMPVASQDYFPLSIGNSWTYRELGIDASYRPIKIIDTLRIDGDLYYYYGVDLERAYMICSDSLGKIWRYHNGEKNLWFDFTLAETDSYFYNLDDPILTYIVKTHRNLSSETKFGILENCIGFIFDAPDVVDEEDYYLFSPDLGMIERWSGMGITFLLDSAIIDGKLITQVSSNPIRSAPDISLKQNYPNPFNPSTTINIIVPKPCFVSLKIYDLLGKEIEILISEQKQPGEYKVEWTANDLPSGIYLYRLEAGDYVVTKKMILQQ